MKQRLLKTIALGLMAMVGINAWADNTVKYSTDGGTSWTEASDLNVLTTSGGAIANASSDVQVELLADQSLNNRITWNKTYTLTITAAVNVTITRGSMNRTTAWLINTSTGTVNLGSDDYSITFQGGGHEDGQRIFKNILGNEGTGRMNVTNCTFKDYKFDTENSNYGYLWLNKNANGRTVFKNMTVDNCVTTEEAFIKSISTSSDNIYLQGSVTFNNCTGTHFYLMGRIRLGEVDGSSSTTITASTPLTINWASSTTAIGTAVVVKAKSAMASSFTLTNETLGLFGNNTDLKLTQAYNLSITSAGAATLVVPFAATIPSGATCYKLTYTSGDNITATQEDALTANSPVLVTAAEGTYKFVSTATSGDIATGSGQTSAYGNMIGNYTADYVVPENKYILTNHSGTVAFRKANGTTNKIQANRAYLDVTYAAAGAPEFLSINFDGNVTAIDAVEKKNLMDDGEIYNLQGVRMTGSSLPKGIYVKNGKKFVVK